MVLRGHGATRGQRRGALDGGQIWWVAPTYPLATPIWRDLKKACRDIWIHKNEIDRRIELPGGGSVSVRSADNPEVLVGVGLDGVVLDEAATMKEDAWRESLRPTLSDKKGWAVFIGTPKGMNWFYDLFQRAGTEPDWARWQRPSSDNPLLTPEEMDSALRELGTQLFSQEYLAQFVVAGGLIFKLEWFPPPVPDYPHEAHRICRAWDKAASAGKGDYSAGVLCAMHNGIFYVIDSCRGQWSSYARERAMATCAALDAQRFGKHGFMIQLDQDPGSAGKDSSAFTIKQLAGYRVHSAPVTGEKTSRWKAFAAYAEAGNVRLVAGPWNREWLDEFVAAPDGKNDDQIDSTCSSFNRLTQKRKLVVG